MSKFEVCFVLFFVFVFFCGGGGGEGARGGGLGKRGRVVSDFLTKNPNKEIDVLFCFWACGGE